MAAKQSRESGIRFVNLNGDGCLSLFGLQEVHITSPEGHHGPPHWTSMMPPELLDPEPRPEGSS